MASTTFEFEHPKGNDLPDDEGEPCVDEVEIELSYEPGDANYGADADGNRGIYVPGYYFFEGSLPAKCEECGHIYTKEELEEMEKEANKAADKYEEDTRYDYPED